MLWRLGLDIGTNSIGGAVLRLEKINGVLKPVGLEHSFSRIFSDGRNPKDKQSNAVKRREPRGARKNRDRYKRRRTRLMRELVEFGLMPDDLSARKALEGGKNIAQTDSDPWILRTRALDEEITPHQLGRAIFHLHQRRGFKSNRKTDRGDNDSGKVHDATKRTQEKLEAEDARTLGELFGRPRLKAYKDNQKVAKGNRVPQPLARVRKSGEGAKWQYDYYPTRALILSEFDQLWTAQKHYHSDIMSDAARDRLRDTIEWQHPLKSPPVGKCTLIPEEERAAKALPSSQRARIFQEVNALRISPSGKAKYPLTKEQRDIIAAKLLHPTNQTARVTFNQIRKLPDLSIYDSFNTESDKRPHLTGDETAAKMREEKHWGPSWFDLDLATQDEIVDRLINEEDESVLVAYLCDVHGLDKARAYGVADCPLVAGYGSLSKLALDRILPPLEADVTVYSDAVTEAGFASHSQFGTGEVFDEALPYYGYILERSVAFGTGEPNDPDEKRYGKIANPTVHVALNQIRAVVNDLLKRFGPPEQIVIELARDLPLSAIGKSQLEKQQSDNLKANEKRRERLRDEFKQPDNYNNRMRLRLYEDLEALGKRCVFTGEQIGAHNLFSDQVEIEHILPFSKTFDDSYSNKTLALRRANRDKKNQTPYEAFSHSPDGYDWEEISKRAVELPPNKRWRFGPDAMERYEDEEGGFLARQLTDTQYVSRLAKGYLEAIYPGGKASNVWVIPGRLTADLRHHWGLNSVLRGHNEPESEAVKKNRNDHRHHTIDAIVVACTDRSMLKRAADQAQENERNFDDRLLAGIDEPWKGFRSDVENSVRNITVSTKPDHGIQAAILKDSAMSPVLKTKGDDVKNQPPFMRKYVPLESLEHPNFHPEKKGSWTIVDSDIRLKLLKLTKDKPLKELKKIIYEWGKNQIPQVKRVRLYKRETGIAIFDPKNGGSPYKFYSSGGNYCFDIWVNKKGAWESYIINNFDAYRKFRETKNDNWWKDHIGLNGQPLKFRIRKGDMLQIIDRDGVCKIVKVYKFSGGNIHMHEHFEANASDRIGKDMSDIKMATSSLQKASAKRVTVSPSGVVKIYS